MLSEYHILKPFISNYIFDEKYQYKDFDKKEVVGVVLASSSLIRKEFTINRIKNLISKKELNLSVSEEGFEFSTMFTITNKK